MVCQMKKGIGMEAGVKYFIMFIRKYATLVLQEQIWFYFIAAAIILDNGGKTKA